MMDFVSQHKNNEKLLKKRAFVGFYMERRFVDGVQEYRDAVWLSTEEVELAGDLSFASALYRARCFPSYVATPSPTLLVTLSDVPLGCHWFQIAAISLEPHQVTYTLRSLRYFPGLEFKHKRLSSDVDAESSFKLDNVTESLQNQVNGIIQNLSLQSALGFMRFVAILFATLVTGLFKVAFFVGDFSIKAMREASGFIEAITPMFLGSLDFLSKMVGGFYILLAMLWRGNAPGPGGHDGRGRSLRPHLPPPPSPPYRRQRFQDPRRPALQYD